MEAIQVGMYVRLLCFQWARGFLPKERAKLVRITGVTEQAFDENWPSVKEKFEETECGGLVNGRAQLEMDKKVAIRKSRSKAGRKSARAKRQHVLQQKGQQTGEQKHNSGKLVDGSRKKEEIKKKGVELPWASDEFRDAWSDWCDYHAERSQPYKPKGEQAALTKLKNEFDEAGAIAAIRHSWRETGRASTRHLSRARS